MLGTPFPLMGNPEPVYYCIEPQGNGAQVKKEFRQRGMECVNTWNSPPGIYPGVRACRIDGKALECQPPPPHPEFTQKTR